VIISELCLTSNWIDGIVKHNQTATAVGYHMSLL
jgi:hypothetical protein